MLQCNVTFKNPEQLAGDKDDNFDLLSFKKNMRKKVKKAQW